MRHLVPTVYEIVIRYIFNTLAGYSYKQTVQWLQYVCMYGWMYPALLRESNKYVMGLKSEIADILTSISALNPSFTAYIGWQKKLDIVIVIG